ncbi:MAG: hypothetical protein DCF27_04945 [Lysobacteraceae bacterium]|nr:MAG: hypothetical protein DCF27_04945 [Xanthomonadaceae bacterium]
MNLQHCIALALSLCAGQQAMATQGDDATWTAHLRYRYESVDDDAFARTADAHTLRLRLGWSRAFADGFSAGVEAEGVAELNDSFNSGANGRTAYPAITDARALEINQAWIGWRGDRGGAMLGRQRIALDNQRFIGNVGWRQNEQTFDALALDAKASDAVTLRYYYLDRVHRVAGDEAINPLARERKLRGHLGNAAWTLPLGTLVGYGHLVDDSDVASASSRTFGLRWTGSRALGRSTFGWTLERANQRDHANNPRDVDVGYWLAEAALSRGRVTGKLGWEHLGSDGTSGFQTPLATLHAFNGWADKFASTPADGLEDRYAQATGKFGSGRLQDKLAWTVAWHDFRADRGGARYGTEWDASLGFPLPGGLTGLVKLADYRSDGFARDTLKAWFQVEWSY